MEPAHMVRRSSDWAREQIADTMPGTPAPTMGPGAPGQRGICDFMADTPVRRTAAAATSVGFTATLSIAVFWTNRRRCDPAHMAVAIIRHVNNKQDAAWCHNHGYANYATKDGFCVGASGKLIKVGLQGVYS